jgi:imidazoleglycerol-phosphate dehydratase
MPVLDHLLGLLARHGNFDLSVEVEPGAALAEAAACGRALGEALAGAGATGMSSRHAPADEALAHVAVEFSGRPLVVTNVDLAAARVGGVDTDVVARLFEELAEAGGLTLHIRLIEGQETEHVLDAIFKALGAALGETLSRKETSG